MKVFVGEACLVLDNDKLSAPTRAATANRPCDERAMTPIGHLLLATTLVLVLASPFQRFGLDQPTAPVRIGPNGT